MVQLPENPYLTGHRNIRVQVHLDSVLYNYIKAVQREKHIKNESQTICAIITNAYRHKDVDETEGIRNNFIKGIEQRDAKIRQLSIENDELKHAIKNIYGKQMKEMKENED